MSNQNVTEAENNQHENATQAVAVSHAASAEVAGHSEGGISEHLDHAVTVREVFQIPMGNNTIPITETVVVSWVIMAVLIIVAKIFTKKLEAFPGKFQNFIEVVVDGINSLCKDVLGHHWKHFSAYFGTVILFLGIANTIALLGIPWLKPPTKNLNVTAALALMTIILVVGSQIRFKKVSGMIKSWFQPNPIMFPFHLMDYIIRPLSLCLRLFGNIFGAFIMMELVIIASHKFLMPPIFSLYFDIFDGLLQAFVFVFLSMLYVGEAIE